MNKLNLPRQRTILCNWSISESPGNKGSPVNISEARQPIAQMSIGLMKYNNNNDYNK